MERREEGRWKAKLIFSLYVERNKNNKRDYFIGIKLEKGMEKPQFS